MTLDEEEQKMSQTAETELKCWCSCGFCICCDCISFGCCSKGKVTISGQFEKTKYVNGEDIRMVASIKNETEKIANIHFSALLIVTLSNGTRTKSIEIKCG